MELFDRLFKKDSEQDLITWFEKISYAKFPDEVKILLGRFIGISVDTDVRFEASNFGEFQILDFRTLQKAKDGHSSLGWEENMSNPFFVKKEITDFINKYVPKDHPLKSTDILPFARSTYGDRTTYVYFQNNCESPIRLNIDNTDARPRKIGTSINNLIDVRELLDELHSDKTFFKYNLKKGYKDLIDGNRILISDGERVDDVRDYQGLLNDFCDITDGELTLNKFDGREIDGRRKLSITINTTDIALDLEGATDWVDLKIVEQLNLALKSIGQGKSFIELRDLNFQQEFGIVYGNDSDFELLKQNGYTGNFWD